MPEFNWKFWKPKTPTVADLKRHRDSTVENTPVEPEEPAKATMFAKEAPDETPAEMIKRAGAMKFLKRFKREQLERELAQIDENKARLEVDVNTRLSELAEQGKTAEALNLANLVKDPLHRPEAFSVIALARWRAGDVETAKKIMLDYVQPLQSKDALRLFKAVWDIVVDSAPPIEDAPDKKAA